MPPAATPPRLNADRARRALQEFRFSDLFIDELGWNNPTSRAAIPLQDANGAAWNAREISELGGFRVFEVVPADLAANLPDAESQTALCRVLNVRSVENIVIFTDFKRLQSLWLWTKRDGKRHLPRRHVYLKNQPGDLFLSKLAALVVDLSELNEEGNLPITEAAERVRRALDVETVTKAFFKRFEEEHAAFLARIGGIPDEGDRRWYASVLLNRLMFIWFLQRKGFLDQGNKPDGNRDYLPDRLAASRRAAPGRFYSHFLRDLFFEGFAKPEAKRQPVGVVPLGDIPYLNGGLFLPHGIEARTEGPGDALFTGPFARITVPDEAFGRIFSLFAAYSWNLNDTPGGDDRDISPDVLGYIFEKYINQKEFGAYYTRPEITEYLCEQTVHQLVLDAAAKHQAARENLLRHAPAVSPSPRLPLSPTSTPARPFATFGDVLAHADGSLCRTLLHETLPTLSLLDPACGSGAFLVAAMKTLLGIYTGLLGRAEAVQETSVLAWKDAETKRHKAPQAYWLKKKIITENLFGVDIMEEAVEIAKLRLFLALVASSERRDQLEPLPNIEFNLLPGNSLVGLLHVDPAKFDAGLPVAPPAGSGAATTNGGNAGTGGEQGRMTLIHTPTTDDLGMTVESKVAPTHRERVGAHLAGRRAEKYGELLTRKNRLIGQYKAAGDWREGGEAQGEFKALTGLRDRIDEANRDARAILNRLLLEEFTGLGIQFEQATWDAAKGKEGKPQKRPLRIEDMEALQPFHWAYEFDEIIVNRGGFDAIITNPPWENFKPDAKEFFMEFADGVTKNKMRLEDFEERKGELLTKDFDTRARWLAYQSRFPHVNLWFRNTPQYANQTAVINGKKVTTDLNLYKLFLEQTLQLLRKRGYCGIVIPSGIYTDLGATRLREMLFTTTRITGLFGFENRREIFENVDSRFKFVVLGFQPGGETKAFPVVFMRHDVRELTTFPGSSAMNVEVSLIRHLSPGSLSIVEFRDERDVSAARKLTRFPLLGDEVDRAWKLRLQREFHMTDDAPLYHAKQALGFMPLVEGKMLHQFCYPFSRPRYWLDSKAARAALVPTRLKQIRRLTEESQISVTTNPESLMLDYQTYRLAFRDVARNTDERTMMATVLPPNVFCPHTVSMEVVFHDKVEGGQLKLNVRALDIPQRLYLAAVFNSFAVDYQLRQKVTAHLSFFFIYQLPIPRLTARDPAFRPLAEGAARLVGTAPEFDDLLREVFGPDATHATHGVSDEAERRTLRAEMDAQVALLYDLTDEEFAHILGTFPLVPATTKTLTLDTFRALLPSADDAAVAALIRGGENDKVEFKEGAAFSPSAGRKHPEMMTKVLREVAAFLNTAGGSVLLGVTDAGQPLGIADDMVHADPGKPDYDGYELYLRNALASRLGTVPTAGCQITFHAVGPVEVCRILVPASPAPVYLDQDRFLIRAGSTSRSLQPAEVTAYVFRRWSAPV